MKISKEAAKFVFLFSIAAFFYSQMLVWGNYFNPSFINYFDSFYHLELAGKCLSLDDPQMAEDEFRKAIALNPTNPFAHYKLANYYASRPNADKLNLAYVEYNKAMLYSERKFQLKILEEIYKNHAQDYSLLKDIVPKTDKAVYLFAEFLRDKKLYDEAILEFKEAVVLADQTHKNGITAVSYNWIAIIYMWQGKLDEAIEYFNRGLKPAKDIRFKSWMLRNLGSAYLNIGEYKKAEDALKNAIKNDPKIAANYYVLGNVYERMDRIDEAKEYYRKALKFKPDEYTKNQSIKKLEELK